MKNFMEPKSVALIGITRKSGPGSFNLMEIMKNYGFTGKIFPINPHAEEILGEKAYPNISAVNEKIDLAVISSPRETTLDILQDCVAADVKAAIIVNQGFADADIRGKELQREIKVLAKRDGIRILGPNTLGVLNNFNNFTTSFLPVVKDTSPVGVICQSGIFFVGVKEFTGMIGKGIDLGNACDIGFYETLKYFGEDPDIKIIVIHMEGINQGKQLLSLASRVVKEKPIIIYKTGRSETGAKAATSHTGSIAGNYQVFKNALKQAGVTFLEEDGKISHAVKTLLNLPPMKGDGVAVLTFSGGAGIMISDGLERHGVTLASLSPETINKVAELSPEWMSLGNPLDIFPAIMLHGAQKAFSVALKALLNDPNVHGVVCIAIAPMRPEIPFIDVSKSINEAVEKMPSKPVIAWVYGPNTPEITDRLESKKRIMVYPSLEIASWSLSLLRDRHKILQQTPYDESGD